MRPVLRLALSMSTLLALGACGVDPGAPAPVVSAVTNLPPVLPRGLTPEEEARTSLDPSLGASQAYAWECDPGTYGFTPAVAGYRLPAEHEETTGLLIGWPQYGCQIPELAELIRLGAGRVRTTVLVAAEHRTGAEACIRHAGVSEAAIASIEWREMPIDGPWIRDYGPEIVVDGRGARRLIDMSYYPQLSNTCNNLVGRAADDASPSRLAAAWGIPADRAQVRLEGGNLLADGQGTCFRNRKVANARNCFSRWCYTEAELDEVIGRSMGCRVIPMESMVGGVIDHIDMWMALIAPRTVIVAAYDPADDAENAAILDRNAARLRDLGYRVARIPMPKRFCRQSAATCLGVENLIGRCDQTSERIWATYTNGIRVGDVLAVPVYRWVPAEYRDLIAAQEREALATYQRELDRAFGRGAVKVVPVPSDTLIPCQGALHCVSMTWK